MHDMKETVRQSNLQFVFWQTISLEGAMSRYFRVFRENLQLITSLKLENAYVEMPLPIKLSLHHKRNDSEKKNNLNRGDLS